MIRLTYANSAELLLEALARALETERQQAGWSALDPTYIVVPNQAHTTYLKQGLARKTGIAANLRFSFLHNYLAEVVRSTAPQIKVVDQEQLTALLVEQILQIDTRRDRYLEPVESYLNSDQGPEEHRDLRAAQLGEHLGKLFDAYLYTRPQLLESWRQEPEAPAQKELRWQWALWRKLAGPKGPLKAPKELPAEGCWMTLADAIGLIEQAKLPEHIHFFDIPGPHRPALQKILHKLGQWTRLYLYTLNPCLEFWEDLPSGFAAQEQAARAYPQRGEAETADLDSLSLDPPALRLWGRPGRESIRSLNEITDWDFESTFEIPDERGQTALSRFQYDILTRAPEQQEPERLPQGDQSITILEAPGIRREIEAIAEEIWHLISLNPQEGQKPLCFSDIAIVLATPEADSYRTQIGAVFREFNLIPHHVLDVPLATSSSIFEALFLLLALPYSNFSRQDLLRLLTHPAVQAKLPEVDADQWVRWCEQLAIVHGAHHEDHLSTYIEKDLYNWDQGLRRLMLGSFMSEGSETEGEAYRWKGQGYLPLELSSDKLSDAAQLIALCRSLISDARYLRYSKLSLKDWSEYLRILVESYLGLPEGQDERDLFRCLAAIQKMADWGHPEEKVSFRVASELLKEQLNYLRANRGAALADGVVVAPLSQLYSLPYKVVFMPGLGEYQFPASETASNLDLRLKQRARGDISLRERDQYWFLLRVLCTKERLRLSYVSRAPHSGDIIPSSPVLSELGSILEKNYLESLRHITHRVSLRRYQGLGRRRQSVTSDAVLSEAHSLNLREDLDNFLPESANFPKIRQLEEELHQDSWKELSVQLKLSGPPSAEDDIPSHGRLSISSLRRFLEDPLRGWASHILGLADNDLEQNPFERESELFSSSQLHTNPWLRTLFLEWLDSSPNPQWTDLEGNYQYLADHWELRGVLPTGVFGSADQKKHLRALESWHKHLQEALQGQISKLRVVRLGLGQELHSEELRYSPLTLKLAAPAEFKLEIKGTTEALLPESYPPASFSFLARPEPEGYRLQAYELRSYLDHLVRTALGETPPQKYLGYLSFSAPRLHKVSFDPIDKATALEVLARLSHQLVATKQHCFFPFPVAMALYNAKNKGKSRKRLEEILDRSQQKPGPLALNPSVKPELEDALELLELRYGDYLNRRKERGIG